MSERELTQITAFLRGAVQGIVSTPVPEDDAAFRDADLIQDLGCDSLDVINTLFQVEEHFEIKVPEPEIDEFELTKIGNLVAYVQARVG